MFVINYYGRAFFALTGRQFCAGSWYSYYFASSNYGPWIQIMRISSSSVIFRRLSVAALASCRFICMQLSCVLRAPLVFLCVAFAWFYAVDQPSINI
jgi:hypothetical protein